MLDGEQSIVKRAIKGEASAFGLLYDHYQPRIYRFVVIKVGRLEEAEDLTHQVFLSAWQNIRRYEDLGHPFGSWLYHIARNQVIDHYRTKRVQVVLQEAEPFLPSADDSEAGAEMKLELERVRRAVHKLKPVYQDVIAMRFVEELSIKETAAALRRSEGAIKLLQHRAMNELRKHLK